MYKVYPILKPGSWGGVKAGAIKQTLFGTEENPTLVLGFGYDAPTNIIFLMPKDLEGKDPQAMVKEAFHNLENEVAEFEVSSVFNGEIITSSGQDFSSEKILCKSHMLKAHELLKSDELLVSIPRRRCLMAISKKASKELLQSFISLHNDAWEDDSYGNAPILNAVFVVTNGHVEGFIPLDKE